VQRLDVDVDGVCNEPQIDGATAFYGVGRHGQFGLDLNAVMRGILSDEGHRMMGT
jgi:hypothetical protein